MANSINKEFKAVARPRNTR